MEKVELKFETKVTGTTKKGNPRKKLTLVSGVIVAADRLGVTTKSLGFTAPLALFLERRPEFAEKRAHRLQERSIDIPAVTR